MDVSFRIFPLFVLVLESLINVNYCETVRVCPGGDLKLQCGQEEVIVASKARFGRMKFTECTLVDDLIGCENDVLFLIDSWCSGHRRCQKNVPNKELNLANKYCLSYASMYLELEYSCFRVTASLHLDCEKPVILKENEGIMSSHVTAETGCGSSHSPWIISGTPGQTIELHIIDFGSERFKINNKTTDFPLYGVIHDGSERVAFYGDTEKERIIYKSTTSEISIEISPGDDKSGYLLKYKKLGCPDLSPPAHAWYKRDRNQAVIGCEWSQKTWHLSCDGRSWSGVVGNCSQPVTQETVYAKEETRTSAALWLVCVIAVSGVVMVIACVIGIVCIKKYRIKEDVQKSMTLQRLPGQGHYDLDPNIEMASMLYLPYKLSEDQQQQQQQQGTMSDPHRPTSYLIPQDQVVNELTPIRIWERPLPELPDKPLASDTMCVYPTTKRSRTPGDGDEAVKSAEAKECDTPQSYQNEDGNISNQNKQKYPALSPLNV